MLAVIQGDRSNEAWIAASWKQEWEASGPTRVHRHVSDPGEGVEGDDLCREHWTDSIQIMNWARWLQIHEEVRTDEQFSM